MHISRFKSFVSQQVSFLIPNCLSRIGAKFKSRISGSKLTGNSRHMSDSGLSTYISEIKPKEPTTEIKPKTQTDSEKSEEMTFNFGHASLSPHSPRTPDSGFTSRNLHMQFSPVFRSPVLESKEFRSSVLSDRSRIDSVPVHEAYIKGVFLASALKSRPFNFHNTFCELDSMAHRYLGKTLDDYMSSSDYTDMLKTLNVDTLVHVAANVYSDAVKKIEGLDIGGLSSILIEKLDLELTNLNTPQGNRSLFLDQNTHEHFSQTALSNLVNHLTGLLQHSPDRQPIMCAADRIQLYLTLKLDKVCVDDQAVYIEELKNALRPILCRYNSAESLQPNSRDSKDILIHKSLAATYQVLFNAVSEFDNPAAQKELFGVAAGHVYQVLNITGRF